MVLDPPPPATDTGPLTVTDFVVYQGASGDLASIHHDYDVAKAAGYDKPFAPGMYPAGVLASWATAWLGARNIRRYRVRFANMVWPGDVLRCDGVVASIDPGADETTVMLELTCRAWDTIVLRGWATFVVPTADLSEPPTVKGVESDGLSVASG
jgi:acyl dehydratase